jgi:vacuolar-type H+-ATPase catalytic subunit A/Vma1
VNVGDNVIRKGKKLYVELGKGILGRIFDGIKRKLKEINEMKKRI